MNKKIKVIIIITTVIVLASAVYYFADYSHADKSATRYLNGTPEVNVTKTDNGLLIDGCGNDTALIFYPGAKVEYTSYLPMLTRLASRGIDCYLLEMPLNMAMLGENEAESIINNSSYSHYLLSGHSLGGVAAASYLNHSGKGDGLILMATYPTDKISKPVLSIYGSEDAVLNKESYEKSKPLMSNLTEFVVEGGNHAQFGNYGKQNGDNDAKISAENQQNQTVNSIIEFAYKLI